MRHSDETEHKYFCFRAQVTKNTHSGEERHFLDCYPKQKVSLLLHHGSLSEHGKRECTW